MNDVELTRSLERGDLSNDRFHHADHLRVALVYLDEAPTTDEAISRMAATLRQVAARAGREERFSQATTEFWMYQLAALRALMPHASADALFAACPRLLDKNLLLAYYSGDAAPPGATPSSSDASRRSVPRDPA